MHKEHPFDRFLRENKLPTMLCPGCGNGIVLNALLHALNNTDIDPDSVVISAGIGCSGRSIGYVDFCGVHANHGRALAYATGVKLHNPNLKVIVLTGDGDCTAIGGNHFIHAARRNIDITTIVFNNNNYGMTGGQYSSTTPLEAHTKTSVYGNMEPPFDVCKLAEAAGATYVARASTYYVNQLIRYMTAALNHKGFSVVEAICDCPTLYGRLNRNGDPVAMMEQQKELLIPISKAASISENEMQGKLRMGEFVQIKDRAEYTEQYAQIIQKAGGVNR